MSPLSHELRFAVRALARRPGYALVVILILALGVGATTAIFTVVDGVLLTPLPHPESDRLVAVWEVDRRSEPIERRNPVSPGNFADWRERNEVFEHIAAYGFSEITSLEGGRARRILAGLVTEEFFDVLRADALLGRTFLKEENQRGADDVVILSHGLWQGAYGGDPEVIGRSLLYAGGSAEVVGVMPPGFDLLGNDVQLWAPRSLSARDYANRRSHFLRVVARLKPTVTLAEARLQMQTAVAGIREEQPEWMTGWDVNVVPLEEELVGAIRPAVLTLMAAAAMVLLVACANLANLSLARNAARQRELAVRCALGAGRGHLVRASLAESVILSLAGGVAGIAVSVAALKTLLAMAPADLPRLAEVRLDERALLFALAVSLLTALLFGLGPAIKGSRFELRQALAVGAAGAGPRHQHLRNTLVAAEVALAFVLLAGSWLLTTTMMRLLDEPPGFDRSNVLTWRASLPGTRYAGIEEQNRFYRQALDELERLPGVEAAGVTRFLPLDGDQWTYDFLVEGRPSDDQRDRFDVGLQPVSPGYFRAMGLRLVEGRLLRTEDGLTARPVLVINETMARKFFPGESAVGRQGRIFDPENPLREIVGVVADIKHDGLDGLAPATMYPPQDQMRIGMGREMVFALRTAGDPLTLAAAVRRVFRDADSEVPVSRFHTMDDIVARWLAARRFVTVLVAFFAVVALVLTVLGVYGVISYSVGRRNREMALRVALGARPASIRRLVLAQGVGLVGAGIAAGALATLLGGSLLSSLLYGVEHTDPRGYVAVTLVLTATALLASYLPARRASRVDPLRALREE